MRGKKAKMIRQAAEKLSPPTVSRKTIYKERRVKSRMFISPLVVHHFKGVRYFKGHPYIVVDYPIIEMGMCLRKVYQDLKSAIKKHPGNMRVTPI
jgi:hypothetical protein